MFQAWLGARHTAVHTIPLLLELNGRCDQTKIITTQSNNCNENKGKGAV